MKTALAARCSGPFMSTERRSESRWGTATKNCDPTGLRATPLPARERAGVGPGDAHYRHAGPALPGKPPAPEQEAPHAASRSALPRARNRLPRVYARCGDAFRVGRAALHAGEAPGRPDSEGRDAGQASPGPRRRVGPGDAHDGAQLGDAGAYDDRTAVAAGEPPHRGSR